VHSQGRLPPVQTRARQDVLGLCGSPALDPGASPSPRHVQTDRPITASPRSALRPHVRFAESLQNAQDSRLRPAQTDQTSHAPAPPLTAVVSLASNTTPFPSDTPGLTAERWLRNVRPTLDKAAQAQSLRTLLSAVLKGEAFLWLSDLPEEPELDLQTFQDLFLERWGDLVRFKPHEARQAFLERKVVQKRTDNVAKYYGHFLSIVKQAEDMSMTDQITWFIDNLHPDLITTCAVQPNGQPWQSVTGLAHFALGEARMKATRTASHRASMARIARSQLPQDRQGVGGPPPPQGPAKRPAADKTQGQPAKTQKTTAKTGTVFCP